MTRGRGAHAPPPPRPDAEARRAADPPRSERRRERSSASPPRRRCRRWRSARTAPLVARSARPARVRTARARTSSRSRSCVGPSRTSARTTRAPWPPRPAPPRRRSPTPTRTSRRKRRSPSREAARRRRRDRHPSDPPPRFALDLTLAPSRAEGRAPPAGLHEADATEENGASAGGASSSSAAAGAPTRRRELGEPVPTIPTTDFRRIGGGPEQFRASAAGRDERGTRPRARAGRARSRSGARPGSHAGPVGCGRRSRSSTPADDAIITRRKFRRRRRAPARDGSAHAAPKVRSSRPSSAPSPRRTCVRRPRGLDRPRMVDPKGRLATTSRVSTRGGGGSSSAASTASNVDRHAIVVFSRRTRPTTSPPDASRVGATSRKGRQDRRVSKKGGGGGGSLGVIRADSDGGLSRYLLMRREAAKAGGVKALEKLAGLNAAQLRAAGAFLGAASEGFSAADASGNNSDSVDPGSGGGSLDRAGFTSARTAGTTRTTPSIWTSYFWDEEEEEEEEEDVEGGDHPATTTTTPEGSRERRRKPPPSWFAGSAARQARRVLEDGMSSRYRRPRARPRRNTSGRGAVEERCTRGT